MNMRALSGRGQIYRLFGVMSYGPLILYEAMLVQQLALEH